jgi:hypothetical protein
MSAAPSRGRESSPRDLVALGLIITAVGVALMFRRFDFDIDFSLLWPFILMAFGLARLADSGVPPDRRPGARRSGIWLLFVGVWGLVSEFHWFGLSYRSAWPLLIVGAGTMIVWAALDPAKAPARSEP